MNVNFSTIIRELYDHLLSTYGPQGWWPTLKLSKNGINPTKRGRFTGYHPKNYEIPNDNQTSFEIMLGTILTQNTSWVNAEKALANLADQSELTPQQILTIPKEKLAEIIRSSGYYNQKSERLHILSKFIQKNPINALKKLPVEETRKKLLHVKGIGPETADSILLYALKKPSFVIDAYSRRLFSRYGISENSWKYNDYRDRIQQAIIPTPENLPIYNEYHALLVQHCVYTCKKTPLCEKCLFNGTCAQKIAIKEKKKNRRKKKV